MCLIYQALCHEDIWGSGDIARPFLTLALDGDEWSASRTGRFIPGKDPPAPNGDPEPVWTLWRKMPCPCQESKPARPVRSLASIATELSRLLLCKIIRMKIFKVPTVTFRFSTERQFWTGYNCARNAPQPGAFSLLTCNRHMNEALSSLCMVTALHENIQVANSACMSWSRKFLGYNSNLCELVKI
jgi:hypothetical protein